MRVDNGLHNAAQQQFMCYQQSPQYFIGYLSLLHIAWTNTDCLRDFLHIPIYHECHISRTFSGTWLRISFFLCVSQNFLNVMKLPCPILYHCVPFTLQEFCKVPALGNSQVNSHSGLLHDRAQASVLEYYTTLSEGSLNNKYNNSAARTALIAFR